MSQKGKRYKGAVQGYDPEALHTPAAALKRVKEMATAKFDETIELNLLLGLDVRKADQQVRGTVSLPRGTGKSVRVVVFAQADKAREAREAGADEVGDNDLVERIKGGWTDFDIVMATPDMMPTVGKLGPILRARTPNPKSGTVTNDLAKAIREVKTGKIEFRTDKSANIHTVIGKASFDVVALAENYGAVVDEIIRAKPATSKGRYIKSIAVSSTMGPGVKIDPNRPMDTEMSDGAVGVD